MLLSVLKYDTCGIVTTQTRWADSTFVASCATELNVVTNLLDELQHKIEGEAVLTALMKLSGFLAMANGGRETLEEQLNLLTEAKQKNVLNL